MGRSEFVGRVRLRPVLVAVAAIAFAPIHARAEAQGAAPVTEAQLLGTLDRRTVLRAAVERNPAVHVSEQRARAMRASAKAEGGLPPPELMGQVWQVPIAH